MPENRTRAARLIHGLFTRAGLMVASLVALLVLSAIFVASSEGVTFLNVNGKVVAIRTDYTEGCNPGTFVSGAGLVNPSVIPADWSLSPGNPLTITTTGDVGGCLAVDSPPLTPVAAGRLLITNASPTPNPEIFFYTVVSGAIPTAATIPAGTATAVATIVPFPTQSADWPSKFVCPSNAQGPPAPTPTLPPNTCQAYIGSELVNYTMPNVTSPFQITARGVNGAAPGHPGGSLVRVQRRLKLLQRAGRIYIGYLSPQATVPAPTPTLPPPEPQSAISSHSAGETVRSPKIQMSCRARLIQATQAGNDSVSSRYRCYAVVEPGLPWNGPLDDNAIQPPIPGTYHERSTNGTINVTKCCPQYMTLTTDYFGFTCFPYIEGSIFSKIQSTLALDSNFDIGTFDDGQFRITLYNDACITPLPGNPLGYTDTLPGKSTSCGISPPCINERATQLDALHDPEIDYGTDTDFDGCSDAAELTTDPTAGGLRDPFNYWDYFNPANNSANLSGDITAVVNHYGLGEGDALYGNRWDRSGNFPGVNWSFRPADGIILSADITAAVASYGHMCQPSITGKTNTSLNGTDVNVTVGMDAYPTFETPLDWSSGSSAFVTACGMQSSPCQAYILNPNGTQELVNFTVSYPNIMITARAAAPMHGQSAGVAASIHLAGSVVRVVAP